MKVLKEGEQSPKLATFWFIDGNIVGVDCEVRDGEVGLGSRYCNCPESHIDCWKQFQEEYGHTFLHYPRGRVGYDIMTRSFYVIGNEQMIKDSAFQRAVVDKYNLPGKVEFLTDGHYDLD